LKALFNHYLGIAWLGVLAALVNALAPMLLARMAALGGSEAALAESLWCASLILAFGWTSSKVAQGTLFPSFALQLLVGILLHDALKPLSAQLTLVVVVCTLLAAIILKSGGDEIDRRDFLAIAWPTALLAVVGYLITFVVMYALLLAIGVEGGTAAVLAAILGSTDPAALIPTLKHLIFQEPYARVGDMAVAESALNDAVGAIFTAAVLVMVQAQQNVQTLGALSAGLLATNNLVLLGEQLLFGLLAGIAGWAVMYSFERHKNTQQTKTPQADAMYDFAFVLGVPLGAYLLAQLMHGNGFLAAFVAGLLGNFNRGSPALHTLIHSMETKIESVAKPAIFMMMGPFVSASDLVDCAGLGLVIALLFILVARPLAVWLSLLPTNIRWREKMFLCAVRETGVIPVVLAVMAAAQLPTHRELLPLTAWAVIWTLVVLPALTPWWAKKIGVLKVSK
jgi:NhaP-type Na+/H+ or K+/H+ antiporter